MKPEYKKTLETIIADGDCDNVRCENCPFFVYSECSLDYVLLSSDGKYLVQICKNLLKTT